MEKISHYHKKYFLYTKKNLFLGIMASLLAFLFLFIHQYFLPTRFYFIGATLGVFSIAVSLVFLLNEPLHRQFKYGILSSFLLGFFLGLGSYFHLDLLSQNIILFLQMIIIGYFHAANKDVFTSFILYSCFFVVGSGFNFHSHTDSVIFGAYLVMGGLVLTFSLLLFEYFNGEKIEFRKIKLNIFPLKKMDSWIKIYTLELCLMVILANTVSFSIHTTHSYWLPMTVIIIFRPDRHNSMEKIRHRFFGTFLGCLVALPVFFINNKHILIFLMLPILFLIVLSVAKHYGAYVFFITAMISVLMNLVSFEGLKTIEFRLVDTILAICLVMVVVYFNELYFNKKSCPPS